MAVSADVAAQNAALIESLTDEQRLELERSQSVRVGDSLVWVEPEGVVRREKVARLYYVRTPRGVFRYSKIDDDVVEV